MDKEFVPYEEALALKELGFDERCFAWYESDGKLEIAKGLVTKFLVLGSYVYVAPLYQQAFRWFREKCGLYGTSYPIPFENDRFFEYNISNTDKSVKQDGVFNSYEEAELECLRKLIEIVKNKED